MSAMAPYTDLLRVEAPPAFPEGVKVCAVHRTTRDFIVIGHRRGNR